MNRRQFLFRTIAGITAAALPFHKLLHDKAEWVSYVEEFPGDYGRTWYFQIRIVRPGLETLARGIIAPMDVSDETKQKARDLLLTWAGEQLS